MVYWIEVRTDLWEDETINLFLHWRVANEDSRGISKYDAHYETKSLKYIKDGESSYTIWGDDKFFEDYENTSGTMNHDYTSARWEDAQYRLIYTEPSFDNVGHTRLYFLFYDITYFQRWVQWNLYYELGNTNVGTRPIIEFLGITIHTLYDGIPSGKANASTNRIEDVSWGTIKNSMAGGK